MFITFALMGIYIPLKPLQIKFYLQTKICVLKTTNLKIRLVSRQKQT